MILFAGGQGHKIEDAIHVVGAKNSIEGVAAEYNYLEQRFGTKDKDWDVKSQSLINEKGKFFDKLEINNIKENKIEDIYFDISEFFGKLI
ncbi:hypothetical protein KKC59_03205 [bacterium]|nr:hypothetical protein [bacterium]